MTTPRSGPGCSLGWLSELDPVPAREVRRGGRIGGWKLRQPEMWGSALAVTAEVSRCSLNNEAVTLQLLETETDGRPANAEFFRSLALREVNFAVVIRL